MRVVQFRKEKVLLCIAIVVFLIVLTFKSMEFSMNSDVIINIVKNKINEQQQERRQEPEQQRQRQQSLSRSSTNYQLLILTFGGIELTISLDAINDIDDVIYWHEPMKIWERIDANWQDNTVKLNTNDVLDDFRFHHTDNETEIEKYKSTSDFYNELFSCKFSEKFKSFILNAVNICPEYLIASKAVSDLLKCTKQRSRIFCSYTENIVTRMNTLCQERKFNVVVKENIEHIHSLEFIHHDLKDQLKRSLNVLHIVRDPRAVIYDFAKHGRVSTNVFRDDFQNQVEFVCNRLTEDLKFGKSLKVVRSYDLQIYEDVAKKFNSKIFRDILHMKSHIENNNNNRISTSLQSRFIDKVDLTTLEIDWWRAELPIEFSITVENICWESFTKIGYIFMGYDLEMLRGNYTLIQNEEEKK